MELKEIATNLKELKGKTDVVEIQEAIQGTVDKVEEKIREKVIEKKE